MSKTVTIKVSVSVADKADPNEVGESLFDTLCEFANEDLIDSVDGWDPTQ